jgi:Transcriptional regulator, AbiEi antitoxin
VEDRLKGVQTTAQLLAAGLSAGQIRRLIRDGALRRLRHGVYAPAATVVRGLPPDHVVSYRGVPLTSVPRTVIDLARTLPFAEGVAVADSARHARLTSKAELSAVIAGCSRWPGLQRAREVTAFSDARSESVLESLSRAAFHQAGLPPPDLQVWVGDDVEVIGRVDFLWRRYNTIGEADGALKYEIPARARTQLERDARLRAAGYEVVHFSWADITRAPAQVGDELRVAFRRGGLPGSPGRPGDP